MHPIPRYRRPSSRYRKRSCLLLSARPRPLVSWTWGLASHSFSLPSHSSKTTRGTAAPCPSWPAASTAATTAELADSSFPISARAREGVSDSLAKPFGSAPRACWPLSRRAFRCDRLICPRTAGLHLVLLESLGSPMNPNSLVVRRSRPTIVKPACQPRPVATSLKVSCAMKISMEEMPTR